MGHEPHHLSDFKWLRHVCTFTNGKKNDPENTTKFFKITTALINS